MLSVSRCSLIDKRRTAFWEMSSSCLLLVHFAHVLMPVILDPGLISLPFSQAKHQGSVWLHLLHTSSCLWNFFDSESVIDVFGQVNAKVKEGREGGRKPFLLWFPSLSVWRPNAREFYVRPGELHLSYPSSLLLTPSYCNYGECKFSLEPHLAPSSRCTCSFSSLK